MQGQSQDSAAEPSSDSERPAQSEERRVQDGGAVPEPAAPGASGAEDPGAGRHLLIGLTAEGSMPVLGWGQVLEVGPAATLQVSYRFSGLSLYSEAYLGFRHSSSATRALSISGIGAGVGAGAYFSPVPRVDFWVGPRLGYGLVLYGVNNTQVPTANLGWAGALGTALHVTESLQIVLHGQMTANMSSFVGVQLGVGVGWRIGGTRSRRESPGERLPADVDGQSDTETGRESRN